MIAGTCMMVALIPVGIGMKPMRVAPRTMATAPRTPEITIPRVERPPCRISCIAAPPLRGPPMPRREAHLPPKRGRRPYPQIPCRAAPSLPQRPFPPRAVGPTGGESKCEWRPEQHDEEDQRHCGGEPIPERALKDRIR